ncbi:MAG: T9SS type A sorting domain-containing protein [Patescibacteria group bacterium]|nr:T9SS type A sorting domain-containing protein [Patescibacteria group bacterium]MDD5715206.1 T9SS type A sorting domain-containing protein [Patescibacteria group bacterium]
MNFRHVVLVIPIILLLVGNVIAASDPECGGVRYPGNTYECCPNNGNCTWWAYAQRPDLDGEGVHGDGTGWWPDAIRENLSRGSAPRVGSIVCFSAAKIPKLGHVAFVMYVHSDGSFWVSEMNCCSKCNAGVRAKRYTSTDQGFIYGGPVPYRQTKTPSQLISERRSKPMNNRNPYGWPQSPNTAFGSSIGSVGWYHPFPTYAYNTYDNDLAAANCQRAIHSSGQAAIVYDALGGAMYAYCVGWEKWTTWDNLSVSCGLNGSSGQGGPNSCLGMPITNSYKVSSSPEKWRQDFQKGYIVNGTISGYQTCAPGWSSGEIWNSRYSYLFADAYDRNGASRDVGNAMNRVHVLYGNIVIQDFQGGTDAPTGDPGMIMYDMENWEGNECATNEAYWVYGTIKDRYDANGGVAKFGCATIDRFYYGGKWCQDFKKGSSFYRIFATGTNQWDPISPCQVAGKASIVSQEDGNILPITFTLSQNYPNPFNPVTTISYSLPDAAHVTLDVYNILGQRVTVLVDGDQPAGEYSITWDASQYSSGVYFYRLATFEAVETKKMLLLK